MGSTRLPGKVMKKIQGKPLIGYLIDRLKVCTEITRIIAAIPVRDLDSPLGRYLKTRNVDISIGPEDDVARRFSIALKDFPCEHFVRVCADSPLMDPREIDRLVRAHKKRNDVSLTSQNSISGLKPEVVNSQIFLKTVPLMDTEEREHVTLYFYRLTSLVVDTRRDFQRIKRIIESMDRPHTDYGSAECLSLLQLA
jgi:spore coat polysaccharide biosynthesis protein SpsF